MHTEEDVRLCLDASLHVFAMRALERTDGSSKGHAVVPFENTATTDEARCKQTRVQQRARPYLGERMQAFKVIERIMVVAPSLMPKSLVFGIDAVAREASDALRTLCLELLRRLVVVNTRIVAVSFGLSTLFDAVLDPSLLLSSSSSTSSSSTSTTSSTSSTAERPSQHDMQLHDSILLTLLHVANTKQGRQYLRSGPRGGAADFRRLLSPLVNPDYPKGVGSSSKKMGTNTTKGGGGGGGDTSGRTTRGDGEREARWNLAANACVIMVRVNALRVNAFWFFLA